MHDNFDGLSSSLDSIFSFGTDPDVKTPLQTLSVDQLLEYTRRMNTANRSF